MLVLRRSHRRSTRIILTVLLLYASWTLLSISARTIPTTSTFENNLHDLLGLLPDDRHTSQLLSPIDHSSGESMLWDLATRTRLFGKIFTAWESVHHVTYQSEARPSTITLIRRRFPHSADQLIEDYDRMRCFFNRLTQHLFPWTMAYFADHTLLRASFLEGGRGIVITVGDRQVSYATTLITTLRKLGCDLPVEVFYLGEDDLHLSSRSALRKVPGVVIRDLSQMIYDKTWKLKGMLNNASLDFLADRFRLGCQTYGDAPILISRGYPPGR
jgi:alpha 1,3-mannosyltransferase